MAECGRAFRDYWNGKWYCNRGQHETGQHWDKNPSGVVYEDLRVTIKREETGDAMSDKREGVCSGPTWWGVLAVAFVLGWMLGDLLREVMR